MADFPGGVYSPRTKENKPGVEYDATKTKICFAEDISKLDDEVMALETFLSPKLLTFRPEINIDEIKKQLVPEQVQIGIVFGYTMPIYNADNQEIFFKHRVPYRWDGSSNIRVKALVALSGAEDIGDKFQFRLAWEHIPIDGAVPVTANDVDVETIVLLDRNGQYAIYGLTFTIDYDIDGEGNEVAAGELLNARLRRIAASELEVTNNIIVLDWVIEYQRDKFGVAF